MKLLYNSGAFSIEGITVINPEVIAKYHVFGSNPEMTWEDVNLSNGDEFYIPDNIIAEKGCNYDCCTMNGACEHCQKEVYSLKLKEPLEELTDAMNKKNIKVTFGLKPHHIETIENEIHRWDNMPPLKSFPDTKVNHLYSKHIWDDLWRKLGWCPFTLALYYFEYLEDKSKEPLEDGSKEKLLLPITEGEYLAQKAVNDFKEKLKADIEKKRPVERDSEGNFTMCSNCYGMALNEVLTLIDKI